MPEPDFCTCPIGLFDSGVGGLTVLQEIARTLPNESLIYFGDTARVPYGDKGRDTIIRYGIENTFFLLEKQIKLLVVACNTVTALAMPKLRQICHIPIIGVIEPGAEKVASITRNQRIAILGTRGTIQSNAYPLAIKRLLPQAFVISLACPLFVPLVEEHFLDHPATHLVVKEYLKILHNQEIDTLLLGCTHYPLLKHLIQQEMGPNVTVLDSASSCAEKVFQILKEQDILAPPSQSCPSYTYYVSDDADKFRELGEKLFNQTLPSLSRIELKN